MSGQFLDTTLAAQFKRPYRNCPDHTNLSPALPLRGSPDRDLSFHITNPADSLPIPNIAGIWKGADGALLETPAVSQDGGRVAIVLRRSGKRQLHVLSSDGAELQPIAEGIVAQGSSCWSPDGRWIVTGGSDATGPGLFKIPLEGGSPVRLVAGQALNPVWSPDGSLIVYAGTNVSKLTPLLAVRPDGTSVELPHISLRRLGEHVRFSPDGKSLIYMQGLLASQDFWLLDLASMKSRPLTRLQNRATMRTFDVTSDGKQIVFDRLRENSQVVMIDLPKE